MRRSVVRIHLCAPSRTATSIAWSSPPVSVPVRSSSDGTGRPGAPESSGTSDVPSPPAGGGRPTSSRVVGSTSSREHGAAKRPGANPGARTNNGTWTSSS
ncbi:MAG: hypothetical protein U1E39_00955 [Planctomycetota bacterium]